jgi:hypothetical protein
MSDGNAGRARVAPRELRMKRRRFMVFILGGLFGVRQAFWGNIWPPEK